MRNPVMAGERVYLRSFEVEDAKAMAEASHIETETFMDRGRNLISPIAGEQQVRDRSAGPFPQEDVVFAVCLMSDDRCIGMVDLDGIDLVNGVAETGIWMHDPACRGQGFGSEAYQLLLQYAFDHLHLDLVVAQVFEANRRSAAMHEKQRYRLAGSVKYQQLKDGRFQDMLAFDLTRDEWAASRKGGATCVTR